MKFYLLREDLHSKNQPSMPLHLYTGQLHTSFCALSFSAK